MERTAMRRIALAVALVGMVAVASPAKDWEVARSSDGVPIAYKATGIGRTTLIFVHGWSCDSRYWREQARFFSHRFTVVVMDLAGHGNSGFGRKNYTMQSFGADVAAVASAVGAKRVVLIGHSMSGIVIGEAALQMPGKVIGLVGVDTLQSVEMSPTQQEVDGYVEAMTRDFPAAAGPFVRSMLVKGTDPDLAGWIIADMSAAPPAVAVSAFREMMGMYVRGDVAKLFERVRVPVRCVNADLWPTDAAANRRHMRSFDVAIMKGRGHFPMLERPLEFNRLLEKTVEELDRAAK